ncbi:hypothetical protein CCUS01_08504 [Colletotrichum cuscutae]|uniref:Uncharacterized protein n=1 Tax=Colletotrichum cuscutae TaxID=1209917 RepID=A0AAI9UU12_9PEZI|nr:hypothetical protein CCUS01_08504 [Colletotrichum cuscutae]
MQRRKTRNSSYSKRTVGPFRLLGIRAVALRICDALRQAGFGVFSNVEDDALDVRRFVSLSCILTGAGDAAAVLLSDVIPGCRYCREVVLFGVYLVVVDATQMVPISRIFPLHILVILYWLLMLSLFPPADNSDVALCCFELFFFLPSEAKRCGNALVFSNEGGKSSHVYETVCWYWGSNRNLVMRALLFPRCRCLLFQSNGLDDGPNTTLDLIAPGDDSVVKGPRRETTEELMVCDERLCSRQDQTRRRWVPSQKKMFGQDRRRGKAGFDAGGGTYSTYSVGLCRPTATKKDEEWEDFEDTERTAWAKWARERGIRWPGARMERLGGKLKLTFLLTFLAGGQLESGGEGEGGKKHNIGYLRAVRTYSQPARTEWETCNIRIRTYLPEPFLPCVLGLFTLIPAERGAQGREGTNWKEGRKARLGRPSCIVFHPLLPCNSRKEGPIVYLSISRQLPLSQSRMAGARNGGGTSYWFIIVAHFFFPSIPRPNPTMYGGYSNSAILHSTQLMIKTLAIFYGHRLRIGFRFSCILPLPPETGLRDGDARKLLQQGASVVLCYSFFSCLPLSLFSDSLGRANPPSRQKKKTRTLSVRTRPQPNYGVHTQCLPSDPFYARYSLTSSPGAMPPGSRLHAIFSASLPPPLLLGRLTAQAFRDSCHALMLHVRLRLTACPRLFDVGEGPHLEWGNYIFVLFPMTTPELSDGSSVYADTGDIEQDIGLREAVLKPLKLRHCHANGTAELHQSTIPLTPKFSTTCSVITMGNLRCPLPNGILRTYQGFSSFSGLFYSQLLCSGLNFPVSIRSTSAFLCNICSLRTTVERLPVHRQQLDG